MRVRRLRLSTSFDRLVRDEHYRRMNRPITEAAAVVCQTAGNWGGSVSPAMAEAIVDNLAKYFGVPVPSETATVEKKSQFEHTIKLEQL